MFELTWIELIRHADYYLLFCELFEKDFRSFFIQTFHFGNKFLLSYGKNVRIV